MNPNVAKPQKGAEFLRHIPYVGCDCLRQDLNHVCAPLTEDEIGHRCAMLVENRFRATEVLVLAAERQMFKLDG